MDVILTPRITFAEYMDMALYGPKGYYASGLARSGREGDYFTAPDTGPAFGQLLAEIFRTWQQKTGISPFQLIEVGAGEGALAASLTAQIDYPYTVIERSPARQKKLAGLGLNGVSSLDALAAQPISGCLFGNELLDAFPVHRVRIKDGLLEEAYVTSSEFRVAGSEFETRNAERGTRNLVWDVPSTPRLAAYLNRIDVTLPEGYETEINLAMAEWFQAAARALKQGLVLLIDYGRPAYDYYAPERDRGTLRSFRNHRVGAEFLSAPGLTDLTADVDFTSAALDAQAAGFIPLAYMDMGTFLTNGLRTMGDGRRATGDSRFAPRPSPLSLQYLLHPDGMGTAFQVLILGKDVPFTPTDFPNNRLKRLALEDVYAASR